MVSCLTLVKAWAHFSCFCTCTGISALKKLFLNSYVWFIRGTDQGGLHGVKNLVTYGSNSKSGIAIAWYTKDINPQPESGDLQRGRWEASSKWQRSTQCWCVNLKGSWKSIWIGFRIRWLVVWWGSNLQICMQGTWALCSKESSFFFSYLREFGHEMAFFLFHSCFWSCLTKCYGQVQI